MPAKSHQFLDTPALAGHPLQRAFLHRARLDAVRRQPAVDGRLIDPWQLAAVLEGLRLRMADAPRIVDRAETLDAARCRTARKSETEAH